MDLGSRFRLVRLLGGQPHAGAWLAQDLVLGLPCVLKLTDANSDDDDALRQEADRLGAVEHPHLVRLTGRFRDVPLAGRPRPVTGLVTRWAPGSQLAEALRSTPVRGRLEPFAQLVGVVDYLHRVGLLHLDLKPDNVLLHDGQIHLLDLGTARPRDTGRGEAGGTLGYASPEVLHGEAASEAADLYSLGAVLYELLTGDRPFSDLAPAELRRVVTERAPRPIRELDPALPANLDNLVTRLLSPRPEDRGTVAELLLGLAEAGVSFHPSPGAPPFSGREAEIAALANLLDAAGPTTISVVGPPGAGRSRLTRRALLAWSDEIGRPALDLSSVAAPVEVVHRLLQDDSEELAPVPIFLGRRDDRDAAQRDALDAVTTGLLRAGYRVVWAHTTRLPGSRSIDLKPLEEAGVRRIGEFFGVAAPVALRAAVRRSGGWPGSLIPCFLPQGGTLPAALAEVGHTLGRLPPGIPAALVERLPEAIRSQIPSLIHAHAAWWGEDQRLYLQDAPAASSNTAAASNPATPTSPADEAVHAVLTDTLGSPLAEQDPVWFALLALCIDRADVAARLYPAALRCRTERPLELSALAHQLAAGGHRPAVADAAALDLHDAHPERALLLLEPLTAPTAQEQLLRVQALRLCNRLDEAIEHAGMALGLAPPPAVQAQLQLELARVETLRRRLDEAEGALDAATALDPGLAAEEGLIVAINLAVAKHRGRLPVPEAPALAARVEALLERGSLSPVLVSSLAQLMDQTGRPERAEALFAQAVRLADAEGDARRSVGTRANRASLLLRLGRGGEAREVYQSALAFAVRSGVKDVQLGVRFMLARLEWFSGRLPAAAGHLRDLQPLLAGASPVLAENILVLEAELARAQGDLETPLRLLADRQVSRSNAAERATTLGLTWLALGELDRAAAVLDVDVAGVAPLDAAVIEALRGRIALAQGRTHLRRARDVVPEAPGSLERVRAGEILLAAAGEDLDPASFAERRHDLTRAVELLGGEAAGRAVTLRDTIAEGPGAGLQAIVALTEAMQDPRRFPAAVSQLVRESLGAHRVLLMMRLPGLGRVTHTELSGAEAAGISAEVLRRVKLPTDVWVAHDAFGDPELRRTSHTVRTFQLRSLLAVAIPQGDKAVGALYVDDLYRTNRFGPTEIQLLQRLARAVGALLPTLNVAQRAALVEPEDVYGQLLTDRRDVSALKANLTILKGLKAGNLLITGETGTGKTRFAERIAREVLGCAGVVELTLRKWEPQLLVSTLAGQKRGEFTGAETRTGVIAQAISENKVLFLDEMQNLDEAGQQILLPLLDHPRRFGGLSSKAETLHRPLHILLGTNADVDNAQWKRVFRDDLWYRMSQIRVNLPPLRQRGPEVVYRYLTLMLEEHGLPTPEEVFETDLLDRLNRHPWAGNLRELRSMADRAAGLHRALGRSFVLDDLGVLLPEESSEPRPAPPPPEPAANDREFLLNLLARHNFRQKPAAEELGISPSKLNKLLTRHNIRAEVKAKKQG